MAVTRVSVARRVAVLLAVLLLLVAGQPPAAVAARTTGTSVELLAALETAAEHPAGYKRTLSAIGSTPTGTAAPRERRS